LNEQPVASNISSFVEKFKASQSFKQAAVDRVESKIEAPQILINTTNSYVTAQQTSTSVANSTVARIRTLEQIRPLLEKNLDKERSNSINGSFQPKNAQKVADKNLQQPSNKDS
jgi:hypothetical protein